MRRVDELKSHLQDLPVFPIPQAVFFPDTVLPLHVFEPRYRQMVADARDGELPIAVTLLRPEEPADAFGPVFERVCGAGFISKLEELPDGRFLLELDGIARIRVVRENKDDRLYRTVAAAIVHDEDYDEAAGHEKVETLSLIALGLHQANPKISEYLSVLIEGQDSPAAVGNVVASVLFPDADTRQALLEDVDPAHRLEVVIARLSEVLALSASPGEGTTFN